MIMHPLCAITTVMLISGALGGVVNYFLSDTQDEKTLTWWQHVFVGIVAAFIVPLFLNMASGDLIDKIRGVDGRLPDYSKLFVLAGFCLVAAASSRAFIRSLSERVLQEVRSAKKKAEEAKEDAAEAKAAVAPFVEDEVVEEVPTHTKLTEQARLVDLTSDERAVLGAMATGPFSMRSISGIASDCDLPKSNVNSALTSLVAKGYVGQGRSSTSDQPRWFITQEGRNVAASS
jgi:fluoride ion exporter CrcB/FEX/DNA-binding MarR family transcriptional regulator